MLDCFVKYPTPKVDCLPAWMREERYVYCEHFDGTLAHKKKSSVFQSILHFFNRF